MADEVIKFGTDGWRAGIAKDYTFDNLRRVAAAAAQYYIDEQDGKTRGVVIGHDRRFLAREFAIACAEVVAGHGVPVWLTRDAAPTPVISFSVLAREAAGAINVTASHNPPTDLGFKVRADSGAALAPDALAKLESRLPPPGQAVERMAFERALEAGAVQVFDPAPDYRAYLGRQLDLGRIAAAGLRVAYDPMWGAGIGWLQWLLGPGAATRLLTIHGEPDPTFPDMIRPEPIPPNTDSLRRHVLQTGADVGIANDGDADRIGAVDEDGRFINQLQMYGLLAYYLLVERGERRPIVKTLSTTSMLDALGRKYGVDVHETGVGFKFVGPKMLATDAMIGGEESGGFAFDPLPERDGLLAALALLDLMIRTGERPSQLIETLYSSVGGEWFYKRLDFRFADDQRETVRSNLESSSPSELGGLRVERIDRTDGFKFWFPDGGWFLLRFSGTEPLLRAYVETTHGDKMDEILADGLDLTGLDIAGDRR